MIHRVQRGDTTDLIGCDAVAAEVIQPVRRIVNDKPLGCIGKGQAENPLEGVGKEHERRRAETEHYEALSKHYPLTKGSSIIVRVSTPIQR